MIHESSEDEYGGHLFADRWNQDRRREEMQRDQVVPSDTSLPDPLNILAKQIGVTIEDQQAKSKETLKELLKTSLDPSRHEPMCLPFVTNVEKCEVRDDNVDKSSEKTDDSIDDKQVDEKIGKGFGASEEEIKDRDDTECLSSETDEVELSFDSKWLKEHFEVPLKMAIKELVTRKPYDPVNYLGFWLLHYKKCLERDQWQLEKDRELNYLRSVIREPKAEVEERVSVDTGGEGEEGRDWNFERYSTTNIST